MRRCVIVGGAEINRYDIIRAELREDDFFVFCDSGLKHLDELSGAAGAEADRATAWVKPDLIVGDFDSYDDPHMDVETITLPVAKDDTDTFYAAKEMVRRGFEEFLLIGVIGGRLDHTLANLSILLMFDAEGKKAKAIDDFSEMEIVSAANGGRAYIEDSYSFFSILNISGTAKGINIRNAKFPLENGDIGCEYQYGVSNEVLPGEVAEVSIGEGKLLLVKDF